MCGIFPLIIWGLGAALLGGIIGRLTQRPIIKKLQSDLSQRNDLYAELEAQYRQTIIDHNLLLGKFHNMDLLFEEHKSHFKLLKQSYANLQESKDKSESEFISLKFGAESEKRSLNQIVRKWNVDYDNLLIKYKDQDKELNNCNLEKESLKSEIKDLKIEFEQKKNESSSKYQNLKTSYEGIAAQHKQLSSIYELYKSDSENKSLDWQSRYDDLEEKYEKLAYEKEDALAQIESLKMDYENSLTEQASKHEHLNNLFTNFKSKAKDDIEKWENKYSVLNQDYRDLETKTKREIGQRDLELSRLINKYTKVSEDLSKIKSDLDNGKLSDQQPINDWESKYKSLNGEYTKLGLHNKSLEEELSYLKEDYKRALEWENKYNVLLKKLESGKSQLKNSPKRTIKNFEKVRGEETAKLIRKGKRTGALKELPNDVDKEVEILKLFDQGSSLSNSNFRKRVKRTRANKLAQSTKIGRKVDPVATALSSDDLKKIEGIGPKIEKILNAAQIKSFKSLSLVKVNTLRLILEKAGPRFQMHDPSTWAKQAELAFKKDWDKLKALQSQLVGGRPK